MTRCFNTPVLLLSLLFTARLLVAPQAQAQYDAPAVTAKTVLSVDKAVQGGVFQAAVIAALARGFHVNAHKPTEKWLIPTELTVEPLKGVTVDSVLYPRPVEKALVFAGDQKLALYEGTFTIGLVVKTSRDLPPGLYTLKGTLGYQACNDEVCMAPDEVPVAIVFEVAKAGQASKSVNREVFSKDPFLPKNR
jgi:DsbC/DsbD-like thiol-disulfide interchange protein